MNVRMTGRSDEFRPFWGIVASLSLYIGFVPTLSAAIGDGTTAGNLRTTVAVTPKIAGLDQASLVSTDDLWDLSAEVDTVAATRRAYWLYSDGTFDAGTDNIGTDLEALALLPVFDAAKSVLGVYVAGPATDFDDAGGLAAQGTITDQVPAGAYIGIPGQKYTAPGTIALVPA